jgi:hypothetical protein
MAIGSRRIHGCIAAVTGSAAAGWSRSATSVAVAHDQEHGILILRAIPMHLLAEVVFIEFSHFVNRARFFR